jgi:hypothetical protein
MAVSFISHASNDINSVIISGQVVNMEYGNPVEGHVVYIQSDSAKRGLSGYFKTIITNSEGYYYDTVATTEDKGSLVVYTQDYYGKIIDTTVHFRFMDRANSVEIANFAIYMPYQSEKLQARFKYVQKQSDNRYKFMFVDQTKCENVIEWQWDFGDGTTSNIQNPSHVFPVHGLFKITLNITAVINNVLKISLITKQLYISDREYFHMGGHVFSEYFPIDMGYAYLYMIDSNEHYVSIDTVAFDTLGYYFFYHIPSGKYIIKAEPMCQSQYYGTLLPTYFGDKLFWEECETINLTNTSWEYNINLGYSDGFSDGVGRIEGNVVYDILPTSYKNYSAKGVNIYIFDDFDKLLTYRYSDDFGDFNFDQINLNSYKLYPEITGLEADKVIVELTLEQPVVDNIEILIFSNSVSYVIPNQENNINENVGLPYPNPSSETLKIPLNLTNVNNASYEIYNMYGQLIRTSKVEVMNNANVFEISIGSLKNGSYILRSIINNINYDRYFIVVK